MAHMLKKDISTVATDGKCINLLFQQLLNIEVLFAASGLVSLNEP